MQCPICKTPDLIAQAKAEDFFVVFMVCNNCHYGFIVVTPPSGVGVVIDLPGHLPFGVHPSKASQDATD